MKLTTKQRKVYRVRNNLKKVSKKDRYRLSVSRSSKNISAQIIDFKNWVKLPLLLNSYGSYLEVYEYTMPNIIACSSK